MANSTGWRVPADASALALGILGKAHGLRGDMVLRLYNPDSRLADRLSLPSEVVLVSFSGKIPTGEDRRILRSARRAGPDMVVRFSGVDSREAAAALVHRQLRVPRTSLPPLNPGEFYVEDLVGCSVWDAAGKPRGTVEGAFWNGAHDILTVKDSAGQELLVPVVPDFIRQVDLPGGKVVIDTHEHEHEAPKRDD